MCHAGEGVPAASREFTWGLLYFLAHDAGLPESVRAAWREWGLCKDEFTDNGGWPRQVYVRDARRMVSDYVLTELHTRRVNAPLVEDAVAVAYWPPDMHHVRRIVKDEGRRHNEGFVFGGQDWGPFSIPYRALTPRRSEALNLLAASCPSVVACGVCGAVRLEWTFMALGQAAGAAAALAEERCGCSLQNAEKCFGKGGSGGVGAGGDGASRAIRVRGFGLRSGSVGITAGHRQCRWECWGERVAELGLMVAVMDVPFGGGCRWDCDGPPACARG
ncbi:MAG: FAD-dependent oxidoreductase [Paludibaculum sp.]